MLHNLPKLNKEEVRNHKLEIIIECTYPQIVFARAKMCQTLFCSCLRGLQGLYRPQKPSGMTIKMLMGLNPAVFDVILHAIVVCGHPGDYTLQRF